MDRHRSASSREPYVIGLTGNIATGKSLVGRMLAERGAEHIDADRLAHKVMARGTEGWHEVLVAFGQEIVQPDGEIDRRELGRIVFADPDALARLEQIIHPRVIALTRQLIEDTQASTVVVEAVKLIESGMACQLCDALWVVVAPRTAQLERLMAFRGLDRQEALLRISAQPPQERKAAHADVVIDNGGAIETTRRQVEQACNQIVWTRNE
jgi:dephospho-CoA kinase